MPGIPRRMAVYDDSFDPAIGASLNIFVAGVLQANVESYDIDAGTVTRAALDCHGKIHCVGDEIAIETVCGTVTVERLAPSETAFGTVVAERGA